MTPGARKALLENARLTGWLLLRRQLSYQHLPNEWGSAGFPKNSPGRDGPWPSAGATETLNPSFPVQLPAQDPLVDEGVHLNKHPNYTSPLFPYDSFTPTCHIAL